MSLSVKRPSKSESTKKKLMNDVTRDEAKARLNADIERTLYRKIKIRCVEEDRSISDITRELWMNYLDAK